MPAAAPPFHISPSTIARYFFHDCERFLYYSSATPKERKRQDIPKPAFDQSPLVESILASGYQWEREVVECLLKGKVVVAAGPGELHTRRLPLAQTLRGLRREPAGRFLYQPTLAPPPDFYDTYGIDPELVVISDNHPDLIAILPDEDGGRVLRVIDLKRGEALKLTHRVQILFYALELQALLDAEGIATRVELDRGAVWLGKQPEPELFDLGDFRPHLERFLRHDLGRILATDARMLSATAPDFAGSKVNALVENVAVIWERTAATRGTQMIFCDMGVHPTPWGYSAYDDIIRKLVGCGIPREQIAAVGDADSDAKKQALFEKVRQGSVRVLLGSTQKMGTGTNVQKRLVALHHLDAPWKPAEVEQREGRILRQGDENEEVSVYRYVTEGSFDAYMWQALETKARFITQVMTGDNAARRAEDIGGQELSYAEVKAIASGNPAVLTLAEADAELQRLTLLKKNHLDEQYVARRSVRDLPSTIASLSERLSKLSADQATAAAHAGDPITIGSRAYSREDAPGFLGGQLEALPRNVRETRRVPLGVYRGLRFGLVLHPHFPPDVYLEGAATRRSMLSREHQGPRAVLNALERLANGCGSDCDRVRQNLGIAESQLRDYQTRLGKPFVHEAYLSELTALRDLLKTGLSGMAPETDTGTQLGVAELAERIKTLQAANTIESTPQRGGKRSCSAEEPVTARIRRRQGTAPISAQSPDAGNPGEADLAQAEED